MFCGEYKECKVSGFRGKYSLSGLMNITKAEFDFLSFICCLIRFVCLSGRYFNLSIFLTLAYAKMNQAVAYKDYVLVLCLNTIQNIVTDVK